MNRWIGIALLCLCLEGCSAFVIRHTDTAGKTRTYVTDTVFVGTGTLLDCLVSPLYWAVGWFYFQPYIHVSGGNLSYPALGGSGCFNRGFNKGTGFWGTATLNLPYLLGSSTGSQVNFVDLNHKEITLIGGSLEVVRVTRRVNFDLK